MQTRDGLSRYVGVKEVCDALKISRSTLDRMRREGGFPPHQRISKNRVGWPVSVVEAHLTAQASAVAAKAVLNPDQLSPEDAATAIAELGSRLATAQFGRPVTPSEIEGVRVKKTSEELTADVAHMEFRVMAALFLACSRLDPIRASLVAAGLLPAIRDEIRDMLEAKTGRDVDESNDQLQAIAADILDQAMRGEFVGPGSDVLMPKLQ